MKVPLMMFSLLLTSLLSGTALAGSTQATVTVSVTVLAVPCHINGDKPVSVEFGDVRTDLIDGKNYAVQTLPVSITCDDDPSGTIQYSLKGVASEFDADALKTDMTGLAIRILKPDGKVLSPGSWQDASRNQRLSLKVVPEKDVSMKLAGGEFHASATLAIQVK